AGGRQAPVATRERGRQPARPRAANARRSPPGAYSPGRHAPPAGAGRRRTPPGSTGRFFRKAIASLSTALYENIYIPPHGQAGWAGTLRVENGVLSYPGSGGAQGQVLFPALTRDGRFATVSGAFIALGARKTAPLAPGVRPGQAKDNRPGPARCSPRPANRTQHHASLPSRRGGKKSNEGLSPGPLAGPGRDRG